MLDGDVTMWLRAIVRERADDGQGRVVIEGLIGQVCGQALTDHGPHGTALGLSERLELGVLAPPKLDLERDEVFHH
jgi:hypothetical protein